MQITSLLQELLAIGRAADFGAVERLTCAGRAHDVIAFSSQFRDVYPEILGWAVADRVAIAKAAAALEQTVGGIGSVTVLALLLRDLPQDAERDALDWILSNTTSYSYYSHGTKSWLEYVEVSASLRARKAARRLSTEEAERERADQAKRRRAQHATLNLSNAVRRGDQAAVSALLSAGASPTMPGPDGTDLVEYAIRLGRLEIAELLSKARVA